MKKIRNMMKKLFQKKAFQLLSLAGVLLTSVQAFALSATLGGQSMECESCVNDTTTCCPLEADAGGNINCVFVGSCVGAGLEDPPAGQQVQPPLIGPRGSGNPGSGGGITSFGTQLTPNQIDFGNQMVGTTSGTDMFLFKTFRVNLDMISVSTDNSEFSAQANCTTLQARDSCYIWVKFSPSTVGPRTGNLTVRYDVPPQNGNRFSGISSITVTMTGNGLPPFNVITGFQFTPPTPPTPPTPGPTGGAIRPWNFGNCNDPNNDACRGGQPGPQVGPNPPSAQCGNGIVEPGEECDDGNNIDGDGCCAKCMKEEVITPNASPSPVSPQDPNPIIAGGGCAIAVGGSSQAFSLITLLPFGLVSFARVYRKK